MNEKARPKSRGRLFYSKLFRRRFLSALAIAAIVLVCGPGCAAGGSTSAVTHFQSSAAMWFHPLPPGGVWPGWNPAGGSADFLSLFQANAAWPRALERTHVIGMYAAWILDVDDQDLETIVAFLNAHNIGIEIEAPSLQAQEDCGSGVEGYVPYGQSLQAFTLAYLQRLQALGAKVPYIKVDEPYFFGSVVNDPRSCHFSVTQVATYVGEYAQLVKTVYPNTAVGDVEPVIAGVYSPDVVTALNNWHDTYKSVNGSPLPFYFADIDFSNPTWPTLVLELEESTKQRAMQFGIIYIGDMSDVTDAEWTTKAIARFQTYQGTSGGDPDYVLFQSWEPHPFSCLPETDRITFTGVLDAYITATM